MISNSTTERKDTRLIAKLARHAMSAGRLVVRQALELYYAMKLPGTPKWAKAVIGGALAYFILPIDAIPDFLPVAGYCDDLGVLAAALATVKLYVTDEARQLAAHRITQWFGSRRDDTASRATQPDAA
jgi:uncharacterized membrane protein YkvA (DUF1232 family)